MSVIVKRRVINVTAGGLRGRDGVTGDQIAIRQTNASGNAIKAAPVNPGAAYGVRTLYEIVFQFATSADTISLEIEGFNDFDPKLIKLPGGVNLPGPSVTPGDRALLSCELVNPADPNEGVTAFEIMAPGLRSATAQQALESFIPGGGTAAAGISPANLSPVIEALGVMLHRGRYLRWTKAKPYVLFRESMNRILMVTTVLGGGRMDYSIHEMVNQLPVTGATPTTLWRLNGCLGAMIDGVWEDYANFTGEPDSGGTFDSMNPPVFEPVARLGKHSTFPTGFDWVGSAHWHFGVSSGGIFLNGSTAKNYADPANFPIGTVVRGSDVVFDYTYAALLKDDLTPVGSWSYTHKGVPGGVQILSRLNVTGSDIGVQTLYGGMLSGRGNRLKPEGQTAIAADREDGLEYGLDGAQGANLGESATFQLFTAGRETHIYEAVLNGGGPVSIDSAPYGWSGNDGFRDSWLQDRTEGYAKVYIPGVNRISSLLIDGKTLDMNVTYRARKGALV